MYIRESIMKKNEVCQEGGPIREEGSDAVVMGISTFHHPLLRATAASNAVLVCPPVLLVAYPCRTLPSR